MRRPTDYKNRVMLPISMMSNPPAKMAQSPLFHRPSDLIHGIIDISNPPYQRKQPPFCHLDPTEPYFEHTIAILSANDNSPGALDLRVATDQPWTIALITTPRAADSALQLVGNVVFTARGNPIVDVIHLQRVSTIGCTNICRPKFELHGTVIDCRMTDEGDSVLRVQTSGRGVIMSAYHVQCSDTELNSRQI